MHLKKVLILSLSTLLFSGCAAAGSVAINYINETNKQQQVQQEEEQLKREQLYEEEKATRADKLKKQQIKEIADLVLSNLQEGYLEQAQISATDTGSIGKITKKNYSTYTVKKLYGGLLGNYTLGDIEYSDEMATIKISVNGYDSVKEAEATLSGADYANMVSQEAQKIIAEKGYVSEEEFEIANKEAEENVVDNLLSDCTLIDWEGSVTLQMVEGNWKVDQILKSDGSDLID